MSEPGGLPQNALLGGVLYELAEVLPCALTPDERVVVCAPANDPSDRRFLVLEAWCGHACDPGGPAAGVTAASPSSKKLELFRSLFCGRDDVYAHGYRKGDGSGKPGYTPACVHEWDRHMCGKPKVRCGDCPNRAFSPLTDAVLLRHFAQADERLTSLVGLYVMLPDDTVRLLVTDFDKDGWQDCVRAYRAVCRDAGVPVAVERSRSGNGAHAWVFFEEPVPAKTARAMGSALLTRTMARCGKLAFDAYDRMLPAQDLLPQKGLGNLVALPFQAWARAEGNSVFVDDSLTPYIDQWAYLASVERVPTERVESLARAGGGGLGPFAASRAPGEKTAGLPASHGSSSAAALPAGLRVVHDGMLRIPKAGLSAPAVDALRRLAACPNSDFYRAQAMRQSTYRIPRVLFFGEEDGETLSLPRGCLPALEELFEQGASSCELVDRRACGRPVAMSFVGELRPEQRRALGALLGADCGVLEAATGFGKTVVAAALIAELGVSTLVLVPTSALLDQWCEQLGRFLAIEDEPLVALTPTGRRAKRQPGAVGRIGGGHTLRSGLVDVALCQSLVGHDKETGDHPARQDVLRDYGLVICDECHHVAAETFSRVVAAAPARRLYGLSATPRREDSRRPSVFMYCGPVVHTFDAREHRAGQAFARRLVPRFLATRLPEDVRPNDFVQVGAALARDPERNAVIVADALRLVERGRTPIVLVRLVEHARLLGADLERLGATVYVLVGSDDEGRRQEALDAVRAAPKGEPFVLVATGSYAGEGFDDDRLDALLLAAPVKGQRLVSQYTGRLHRDAPAKSDVVVYDYVDVRVPMLERMHHARLSTYGKLGYDVSVPDGDGETPGTIVDREELPGRLSADVAAAKASVTVVTRYALLKAGSPLADALADARARGVRVTLRVGSLRSSVPADLRPCLQVEAGEGRKPATSEDAEGTPNDVGSSPTRPAARSNFAVIDGGTVWYGELPLLAPERDEDLRALRFHNPAVAHELLADAGLA